MLVAVDIVLLLCTASFIVIVIITRWHYHLVHPNFNLPVLVMLSFVVGLILLNTDLLLAI